MKKVYVLVRQEAFKMEDFVSVIGVYATLDSAKRVMREEYEENVTSYKKDFGSDFVEDSISEYEAYVQESGCWTDNHVQWKIALKEVQ